MTTWGICTTDAGVRLVERTKRIAVLEARVRGDGEQLEIVPVVPSVETRQAIEPLL